MRKFFQMLPGLVVALAFLTTQVQADEVLDKIKKTGVLKVGMSTFVPWAMRDKNGQLIGFEIDVAKKVAEDMGVKVEFVPTAWDGIIPALLAGKFDVIIGGMTITPKRNLSVLFTQPYSHSGTLVAVSKKHGGVESITDLNKRSVTLAVRRGTTPSYAAKQYCPKAKLRQYDDTHQALQEVLNGHADAVLADFSTIGRWTAEYSDQLYMPFDEPLNPGSEGFALRQGNHDALNWFNHWIEMRTADGWLKKRHDYWFKTLAWKDQVAN